MFTIPAIGTLSDRFFDFYWEVYVPDHSAVLNRWTHLISNLCALLFCGLGVALWSPFWFALGVWCQLGPPYLGHILFENTHRSIDQSWIWAFVGSWYTTSQILLGRQCVRHPPRRQEFAPSTPSREELLALLREHGRNLHSFMVLEPGLQTWGTPDGEAAVAYADRGGHWVAVGGPLCAPERSLEVVRAFADAAEQAHRKVVFFGVSQRFVDRLAGAPELDALPLGQAPVWDPGRWAESVGRSGKLRNRLRRGAREGVVVRRVDAAELEEGTALRARMTAIADGWLASKALPPMGFMVTLELFQHAELRRTFVAEHAGEAVGFAVCVPIYGRAQPGWLVEDMLVHPDAPAGTSELLVDAAMRGLAAEGAGLVSLGMVVLAGLERGQAGERHPWLMGLLRASGRTMGWLYNFEGLYRFRRKLEPTGWEPVLLVTVGPVSLWTVRAVLMAFAGGWLSRFALRLAGRTARRWLAKRTRSEVWLDGPTAALLVLGLGGVVGSVLGLGLGWLPVPLAVLGSTVAAYLAFTPVHEAAHGHVSRVCLVNGTVGHLASTVLAGAFLPYRYLHGQHHAHPDDPERDPDGWSGRGPWWALPLRWLTADLGYLAFYAVRWSERPLRERANLAGSLALITGVVLGAAAAGPGWLWAVLLGWLLPARLAMAVLACTFTWIPHQTALYEYKATAGSTLLRTLLLGQSRHRQHHADPSAPFYAVGSGAPSKSDRASTVARRAEVAMGSRSRGTR